MTVDLDRAEQLATLDLDAIERRLAGGRALDVSNPRPGEETVIHHYVADVAALVARVRALTDAGDTLAAVWAEREDAISRLDLAAGQAAAVRFHDALTAWRLLVDATDEAGEPPQTAQDARNDDGDTGTGRRHHDGTGAHSVEAVPVEQLRAAIRLLYPDEMTPTAKRMFDSIIEAHTEPGEAIPQSPEAHDGTEAHEHKWELPDGPFRERLSVPPQQPYTCECGAHAWLTRAQTRP